MNVPYDELKKGRRRSPKTGPLFFIAGILRGGRLTRQMCSLILGFDNAYVLEGASGWNAGGQVIYSSVSDQKPKIVPKPKDLKANFEHPPVREYKTKINLTEEQLLEFDGKRRASRLRRCQRRHL